MLRFRFGEVKRNKGLLVLVLPLIVAVFLVGWFFYVVGQRGSGVASKDSKPKTVEVVCIE